MNFENEQGQPLLPGFEQAFEYRQKRGHGSGQLSSQTEDWYTNAKVVELTRELFHGKIDLDPMSCEEANRVVQAETFYTAEIDGLNRPWFGRILLNPPWGATTSSGSSSAVKKRAVKKVLDSFSADEVKEAICVLNANAITTSWFAPLLKFPICIPPRRIEHWAPGGGGGSPNTGTVLVYIGVHVSRFAEIFGDLGCIMIPYDWVNT